MTALADLLAAEGYEGVLAQLEALAQAQAEQAMGDPGQCQDAGLWAKLILAVGGARRAARKVEA